MVPFWDATRPGPLLLRASTVCRCAYTASMQSACAPAIMMRCCRFAVGPTKRRYVQLLCSAAFVTHTLAPLLPPGGRPYETFWSIIQFRYVAWGRFCCRG